MKPTCQCDRRTFVSRLAATAVASVIRSPLLHALGDVGPPAISPKAPPRGNRVQWARLATPSRYWAMHQEEDARVAQFIRDMAQLDLDPKPAVANWSDLDQMSQFPLLFTNSLTPLDTAEGRSNLVEYVKRGGFLYVDGCVGWNVTPDFQVFYKSHLELFRKLFPNSIIRMLPETDPIFRSFFPVKEAATRNGGGPRGHWGTIPEGLYGVFQADRMVSLLSLDHLWCGWPNDPERMANCVKEIANIYVYAMTR